MPKHPLTGIVGSKPRAKTESPDATNLSTTEKARAHFEESRQADLTYKKLRNSLLRDKHKDYNLQMALRRNALIERELVLRQLAWILKNFQTKLLNLPHRIGAHFGRGKEAETSVREMVRFVEKCVHEYLEEIADLPNQSIDPKWMQKLEEAEEED